MGMQDVNMIWKLQIAD